MKLLTPEITSTIPKLYEQEGLGAAAIVHAKFFLPGSVWTWYVVEFDGEDLCFGLVVGMETELGYFTISELEDLEAAIGRAVERDLHWTAITMGEVRKRIAEWGLV
jgi:hypothetical protein